MDPRRNSFLNLIASVETGVDIEFGGNLEEDDDNIQELLAAATSGKKEKKKKKKDKSAAVEPIIEEGDNDEEIAVKKKKKKKKDKKKKKKKKGLENDEDPGESDLEMDSDDDLSLGSVPGSSSSDDDDDDEEEEPAAPSSTAGLSKGVSNRALMADGQFKMPGFQRSNTAPNPGHNINSKRRNTLGAALKGFQIDVKSLQQQQADGDHSESDGLDQMTSLKSNLPTLSVAGIKVKQRRRQSAFDSFLKDSSLKNNNNDGSENSSK